jgi:hypothetical protein
VQVVSLQIQAIDQWLNKNVEYIGSKAKSWYLNPAEGEVGLYLFKEPKPGTGEDWSELVAFQLAQKLGIPCAEYKLASLGERRGVISRSFVPSAGELIVGTELMAEVVPDYSNLNYFKRQPHTVDRVFEILRDKGAGPPLGFDQFAGVTTAEDVFVGYLMLDALVGNGDRHDENWGMIRLQEKLKDDPPGLYLAPTYDHAACLGRELPDEQKEERLTTKDKFRTVSAYVDRNRSAFYATQEDKRTASTLVAFQIAAKLCPGAAEGWLSRLQSLDHDKLEEAFGAIPGQLISKISCQFGISMLAEGKKRLLA